MIDVTGIENQGECALTTENYEIMMAVFPTEDGAQAAVDELEAMAKNDTIEIVDAAVLVREADGDTKIQQHSLPSVKKGAKWGAVIGGVAGLIFPPSIIGGALLGAGLGAGGAKLGKMALESDDLKEAANDLEPGTSAFVAVVDNTWVTKVSQAMEGYSKLSEHALDADSAAMLGIVEDDTSGTVTEYGSMTAVDPETGARVVADATTVADTTTGDVISAGQVVAADPETGDVAAAGYVAAGNVADTAALDDGTDDSSDTDSPDADSADSDDSSDG
jgi:uncharacterized membrane protein